jgi:integrase/recombinase XerD
VAEASEASGLTAVTAAPAPPTAVQRAVGNYLRHVTIERGLSANTVAAYRRDLASYLGVLAERGISTPEGISEADVAAFASALRSRPDGAMTASSMARMLSTVRGFHRFLVDENLVDADVASHAKPPKLAQRLPKAITVEQMGRVLDATGGEDLQSLRDRALLELLYATGARVSEAVALNVDDILGTEDGASDVVRLLGKGSKQRLVPVGSYARAALDAYLVRARPAFSARGAATPALFLGARGRRLSRQNAWLIIKAAAERSGIGVDISPHTFRHSFATHLLEGGADVRVVQELLGHSSVATTQIYTLVTADTLRDMYTTAHPRARRS